jgi:hypothetical protein
VVVVGERLLPVVGRGDDGDDAGVVDQHVAPAGRSGGRIHHPPDVLGPGYVRHDAGHAGAAGAQLLGGLRYVGPDVADDDDRARAGQCRREGSADADRAPPVTIAALSPRENTASSCGSCPF